MSNDQFIVDEIRATLNSDRASTTRPSWRSRRRRGR